MDYNEEQMECLLANVFFRYFRTAFCIEQKIADSFNK